MCVCVREITWSKSGIGLRDPSQLLPLCADRACIMPVTYCAYQISLKRIVDAADASRNILSLFGAIFARQNREGAVNSRHEQNSNFRLQCYDEAKSVRSFSLLLSFFLIHKRNPVQLPYASMEAMMNNKIIIIE